MQLEVYRTFWGLEADFTKLADHLPAIAASGIYDGVAAFTLGVPDADEFADALAASALRVVPQVFTWGRTVEDHLDALRKGLENAALFAPRVVQCQAGRDAWSDDEVAWFLDRALDIAGEIGIAVAHETHRTRMLYNPWRTAAMVERFDDLRLNLDLSHWVCVSERLLTHERDILEVCAQRALHFDARVGTEEMPQVPDPRMARFTPYVEAFEEWWDLVWDAHTQAGREVTTCAPEFGPPPYQPVDPTTGEPYSDLGDVNDWMARRLRERFAARPG